MTYSIRIFLVDSEGCVYRLPNKKFSAMLYDPKSYTLPRFAGERARMADAVVELQERKPSAVVRLTYGMIQFDALGQFDREAFDRQAAARMDSFWDLSDDKDGEVVQAASRFIAQGSRWEPTKAMEQQIRRAALGEVKCKRL